MVGIYTIMSPTNSIYIGQSWDLSRRERQYKNCNGVGQHRIYNSIKKYGWGAHKFTIVILLSESVSQKIIDFWEQYLIDLHKDNGHYLMNIRGAGSRGKHANETKLKIGISNSGKGLGFRGGPLSEEARSKIRKSLTGKPKSESHKNNLKGPRPYMTGVNHPHWGKKFSIETRAKIKANHARVSGINHAGIKPIIQLDLNGAFIREWTYTGQAANDLKLSADSIRQCARGEIKTSGGFIWIYKKGA